MTEAIEIHKRWNHEKRAFEDLSCQAWISIEDRLPNHEDVVLALSPTSQVVCFFIDGKVADSVLANIIMTRRPTKDYYFCSQEIYGNIFNGITHWMPLPEIPKNE